MSTLPIIGGGVQSLADRATEAACKMLEDGARARQTPFDAIKKNEDMYFGVNTPALKGRSNIPFDSVVMGGFVDSLLSSTQQDVRVSFVPTREQDKMAADKITAVWERESAPSRADWNGKFTDTKLMAILAGVGFNKLYFESAPKFKSDLIVNDHYDMVVEAMGGADLDKHLYKFQMNIFRTRQELLDGVTAGYYDKGQVRVLITSYGNPELRKTVSDVYNNKQTRYATFGIDLAAMGYVGQNLFRLTEGVINFEGRWYYIVFSFELKKWVRFEPLTSVFSHAEEYPGRGAWTAWHTHRHPFIFWAKAPATDVRPIAYTMKKIVNLTIDNLEKRNWDMTAYDPKVFTDPAQLLYRQDGLVRATLKPGQDMTRGLFKFQTPDTTSITINMVEWLNNFLGQKTGVTPDSQGAAQTERVGILVSNLQQVSKRLTLQNKMFEKSVVDLGVMFDYGVYENLREKYAVKIIGTKGAQWEEEVTRKDTERDFSITVRPGDEEDQKNAISAQKRELAFQRVDKHPELMTKLNANEYLRTIFEDAGFDDEKIRTMLDVNNDGDAESRAHAAQAIQDCLEGKELYTMYRGATPGFIQKILDFASDNFDLIPAPALAKMSPGQQKKYQADMVKHDKLIAFAQAHIPIAQKNMERKAVAILAAGPTAPGAPVPSTPAPLPGKMTPSIG